MSNEVLYDNVRDTRDIQLSEDDQKAIKERLEMLAKVFAGDVRAQYKLELLLIGKRPTLVSLHETVVGALSFWQNGTKSHGGGDEKAYICPGSRMKNNGCVSIIPASLNSDGFLVCPKCNSVWKPEQVIGEIMGRHTLNDWAKLLTTYFYRLDSSCDVYLKLAKGDLFQTTQSEQERQRGGELLRQVREGRLRDRGIYPLKNIIKDTSNGRDLYNQLRSFLLA